MPKVHWTEYMEDPEKFLDRAVKSYFLNKKYPSEEQRTLDMMDKSKRLQIRKQTERCMESRLKKRHEEAKDFCTAYEQRATISYVAEPEAVKRVSEMRDWLFELAHDDGLLNELTILKNDEKRLGYISWDRRAQLKREFKEPLKIYEARVVTEIQEAFK